MAINKESTGYTFFFAFALVVVVGSALALAALSIFAFFLLPIVIPHLTNDPTGNREVTRLTIKLAQLLFPYIVFISLSSIYMAIQYSHSVFWAASSGPALLNLVILSIFGSYYVLGGTLGETETIYAWSLAILSAAFVQMLFQAWVVRRLGLSPRYSLKFKHPVIKGLFAMMLPALFGEAVQEIGQLIDIFLATSLQERVPGAVAALTYSHRLMQLPMGIFGIAVATASLPSLSKLFKENKLVEFKGTLVASMRMNFFLLVPATIGLVILSTPITGLLFERGEFTARSTQITSYALGFYAIGILGYSWQKLFIAAFYAQKNSKLPAVITAIVLVFNISLSVILMQYIDHGGLAMGSAIAAYLGATIYLVRLRRLQLISFNHDDLITLIKLTVANLLLGLAVYAAYYFLKDWGYSTPLIIIIPAAAIFYLAVSKLLKVEELEHFIELAGKFGQKFRR